MLDLVDRDIPDLYFWTREFESFQQTIDNDTLSSPETLVNLYQTAASQKTVIFVLIAVITLNLT
jgi:hypothetical protein